MRIFVLAALLTACGSGGKDSNGTGTPAGNPGGTPGATPGGTTGGTPGGTPTGTQTGTLSGTTSAVCGNGTIEPSEDCEPGDLQGETCATQGFTGGDLDCDPSACSWDYSTCYDELDNAPTCTTPGQIAPGPGEEGHWMVARLTPPSWPWTVDSVHYTTLYQAGQSCSPELVHFAEVWAATGTTPDASPTVHEQYAAPLGTSFFASRDIDFVLNTPLTLQQDEHLFVSIQTVGFFPYVNCIQTCEIPAGTADRNWWSYAFLPPYNWDQLANIGIDATIDVTARGRP